MNLNVTEPRKKIINELQKNVNDMSATIESLKVASQGETA